MKRRRLIRHLKKNGCDLVREGRKHSWWGNPERGTRAAVPRHTEISNDLAKEISEAIKFHIECLQEDGEIVPKPISKLPNQTPSGVSAEFVNIKVDAVKPKKQSGLPILAP